MEMVIYTIAALLLYGVSDYILNAIEIRAGKRLPNRSLIFFVIISILAVSSFSLIRTIYPKPQPTQADSNIQNKQAPETGNPALPAPDNIQDVLASPEINKPE